MSDINANIGIDIDASGAISQLKSLQRQISQFHTSIAKSSEGAALAQRSLQKNLINSINAVGDFSAELRTVRTTAESFTNSLEKNKFSMREYFRYAGASTKSFGTLFRSEFDTISKVAEDRVKKMQTQYIKMGRDASGAMKAIAVIPNELDMSNLNTQMQMAAQRQALFNQLVKQGSTNLLNFGKNTQWAGRQLMVGFTIPLISLGSVASKTFMDMEAAAIKFKKVYGDLFTPQEETQAALESIQDLGRSFTQYGIAVADTVAIGAEAAAAGFKGLDLQRQTSAATKLSILGQISQQKALETTISLQSAMKMSSEDLASSIDFLNAVENQTVVTLDDITTAIPKVAPVIQQLGGDVKDLAFFMAALREGGVNASEGANALKSGLGSLINPTAKAAGMLMDMGINIEKIVEDNKGNLRATVIEFAKALDTLDPLARARAIEQLFGKFQFARISTLFDNVTREGNQASRVLQLAGTSVEELASLSEQELGITAESSMNKFRKAVEDMKFALLPVGEEFLKAATPIVEFFTKILEKFDGLGEGTKRVITILTVAIGAIGPVALMTFGLLANGLANIIKLGLNLRNGWLKLTGQSRALGASTDYLTIEQLDAAAAAASLDQAHANLTQQFVVENEALERLIGTYRNALKASNDFAAANPGMMIPRRGPQKFAGGGIVRGPGTGKSDSIFAMLSNGEAVIPAESVARYPEAVNALVSGKIPGFAEGDAGSARRGPFWTQAVRDRLLTSLGLSEGQRVRIPLPVESKQYSVAGTLAPKDVNKSAIGMTKEYLDSAIGNAAFRANLRVGLEEFGSSTARSAEIMQRIGPVLDAAVSEFDNTIEGWQNASTRAIRQIESMPDLSDTEKAALRRRLSPSQEDYVVPSTPVLEVSAEKARFRDERSTAAYKVRRQKQILRQQGFSSEEMSDFVFAHMPGYERIAGQVAPSQPPTVAGRTLTTGQTSTIEELRDEFLRIGIDAENIGEQVVRSASEGFRRGSERALDIGSPSKQMNDVGENAGRSLVAGAKSVIDDAKIAGTKIGDSVVGGVTQSSIDRGPEVSSAFPRRGRGSSRPAGPSPYQTIPGFGTSVRIPENATVLPIARNRSVQEIEQIYKNLGKEMDASRSIFRNFTPTVTNASFALSSLSGMLMMTTNDSESSLAKFNDAVFKASTALMSISMLSSILPGGGLKGIAGRFKGAGEFARTAAGITGSKAAVGAVKAGDFKSFRMARAAGAIANIGSKSSIGAISKFGPMIGKATLMVGRFLGPWGLAIGAVTAAYGAFKLFKKVREEERRQTERLADATKNTADQMKGLSDYFGVPEFKSSLERIGEINKLGGQAAVTSQQRSEMEKFKASEQFKSFEPAVAAISKLGDKQAAEALRFRGIELLGKGYSKQQVQIIIDSIKEAAGKSDLIVDFKEFKIDEKTIKSLNRDVKSVIKNFNKVFTSGNKKNIESAAKNAGTQIKTYINGIGSMLEQGQITIKQFNKLTSGMFANIAKEAPNAAASAALLKQVFIDLDPELANNIERVKSQTAQFKLLEAAMLGVATASFLPGIMNAPEAGKTYDKEDRVGLANQARTAMEGLEKAIEERKKILKKLKEAGLIDDGTGGGTGGGDGKKEVQNFRELIGGKTDAIKEQIEAFKKLRIAGVDAATAIELASDPEFIKASKLQGASWKAAAAEAKKYAAAVKELQLVQEAGQDIGDFTISDLERKKAFIDLQEELIRINYSSELEKQNLELDKQQRQYDLLERQIRKVTEAEIAPLEKIIEDNNYALESISIREEEINKKYDDQASALEKIRSINEDIANLEKGRISLADALTRGDMAAAAQAMADIRQQRAAAKVSAQGNLLESSRNRELSLLGRVELEKQNRDLQFQILTIERNKIQPLQNQQTIVEGTMNTIKDSISDIEYNMSIAIQAMSDKIKQAFGMTKTEIENAVSALNLAKNAGININDSNLLHKVLAVAKGDAGSLSSLMDSLPAKFEAILEKIRKIRDEILDLETVDTDTGISAGLKYGNELPLGGGGFGPEVNTEITGGNKLKIEQQIINAGGPVATPSAADFRKAEAASMDAYQKVLEDEANKRIRSGSSRTAVVAMSSGGFVARGTDTVPAMLTPGEFVVNRRAASSNRGLLEAINSGRFSGMMRSSGIGTLSAPTYNITSGTNAVYAQQSSSNQYSTNNTAVYNYNVTVNSSGSNVNANGIAKAVMDQIKYIDSQRVRVQ